MVCILLFVILRWFCFGLFVCVSLVSCFGIGLSLGLSLVGISLLVGCVAWAWRVCCLCLYLAFSVNSVVFASSFGLVLVCWWLLDCGTALEFVLRVM